MKKIMSRLINIRRDKGITYADIEKRTGIPPSRMKDLESGRSNITIDEMEKLVKCYNASWDQIFENKKSKKPFLAVTAVLAALLIVVGTFYFSSLWKESPGSSQEAAAHTSAETAEPTTPAEPLESEAPVEEAEPVEGTEPAEDAEADAADEPAAEEPAAADKIILRFWGNIPYRTEHIPRVKERDHARVFEIFPVEQLDQSRPGWLQDKNPEHFIINAGTTEIWTSSSVEAFQSLKGDQFQAIGLGKLPEVYEPHIITVNDKKIGFIPLTGLIHTASEIATKYRTGLPRAYQKNEVVQAVSQAKEKVDYLFVLIDWGKKRELEPNIRQKTIAQAIVEGGGDFVIGNHPFYAQEMEIIDGTPVFYALGHSVSASAKENSYNFILEAEFSEQLERVSIIPGKIVQGELRFELTEEDKNKIQAFFEGWKMPQDLFEIVL